MIIYVNGIELDKGKCPHVWAWITQNTFSFDSSIGRYSDWNIDVFINDIMSIKDKTLWEEMFIQFIKTLSTLNGEIIVDYIK